MLYTCYKYPQLLESLNKVILLTCSLEAQECRLIISLILCVDVRFSKTNDNSGSAVIYIQTSLKCLNFILNIKSTYIHSGVGIFIGLGVGAIPILLISMHINILQSYG